MAAGGDAAAAAAGVAERERVGSVRAVGFMAVRLIRFDGNDQLRFHDRGERDLLLSESGESPTVQRRILWTCHRPDDLPILALHLVPGSVPVSPMKLHE